MYAAAGLYRHVVGRRRQFSQQALDALFVVLAPHVKIVRQFDSVVPELALLKQIENLLSTSANRPVRQMPEKARDSNSKRAYRSRCLQGRPHPR
jgi:hypothetical protein